MINHFLIDNYIISRMNNNGIRIMPINFMKKQYPKMNITDLLKIDLGNKKNNNKLINELTEEGLIKFNELTQIYLS